MTIEEIQQRLAAIEREKWDDESAHKMEDKLRDEFISYVRDNEPEPFKAMAAEVLKTADINFSRWCA